MGRRAEGRLRSVVMWWRARRKPTKPIGEGVGAVLRSSTKKGQKRKRENQEENRKETKKPSIQRKGEEDGSHTSSPKSSQ